MILTFKDLIIDIFVEVDDFYKNITSLINKQYFIENNNYDTTNKKRIYKHRIDTLSEEDKKLLKKRNIIETVIGEIKRLTNITTTRIKNVYNYFTNVFSSILAYQIKVMMKLG